MKKNILKQKSLVKEIRFEEKEHNLLKLVVKNEILPLCLREKTGNLLHSKAIKKTVRRVCCQTGRSRGVVIKEKLSRLAFKKLCDKGYVSGIRKV